MRKLFVLLMILAVATAMPAFAATAGPEAPALAIDRTPLAGVVEISTVLRIGEKEVCVPLGRSREGVILQTQCFIPRSYIFSGEPSGHYLQIFFRGPPGHRLLV